MLRLRAAAAVAGCCYGTRCRQARAAPLLRPTIVIDACPHPAACPPETAARDRLGKGHRIEVKPLASILGRLRERQALAIARCGGDGGGRGRQGAQARRAPGVGVHGPWADPDSGRLHPQGPAVV